MIFLLFACSTSNQLSVDCGATLTEVGSGDTSLGFSADEVISALDAAWPDTLSISDGWVADESGSVGLTTTAIATFGPPTRVRTYTDEDPTGYGCVGSNGLVIEVPLSVRLGGGELEADGTSVLFATAVGEVEFNPLLQGVSTAAGERWPARVSGTLLESIQDASTSASAAVDEGSFAATVFSIGDMVLTATVTAPPDGQEALLVWSGD